MSIKTILSTLIAIISFALLTGFRLAGDYQISEKSIQTMSMNADISAEPVKLPSSRDLASDCFTVYINGQEYVICYP